MSDYNFMLGSTGYDFDQMIAVDTTTGNWWHIKYVSLDESIYRLSDSGMVRQSPKVTQAFLSDKIDELFLGEA